jgi:hypothetical protein
LLGIINTGEFWATHIFFLNDHSEYLLIFDWSKDLIERRTVLRELAPRVPHLCDAFRTQLTPYVRGRPPAIFVTSFSEEWDDLSQWRGYTTPGDGYAIVFRPEPLMRRAVQAGWRLEKCAYGVDGETLLIRLVERMFTRYAADGAPDTEERAKLAIEKLSEDILALAPVIKHRAFRGESEWRLISPPLDDTSDSFMFRPGRSFLVQYVTFPYEDPLTGAPRSARHPVLTLANANVFAMTATAGRSEVRRPVRSSHA